MAQLNFNAATVQPAAALDPIPSGWYNAQIVGSEMKPTSAGDGAFLALEIQVMDGPYAGRKVYDRLNLQNKNPVAVEIAYKQLSAICHAVNVIQVQDSQQLHGRPLQVKVSLRPASTGEDGKSYDANNEVKGYKAIENGGAAMPAGAPQGGAPAWAAQPTAAAPAPQQQWQPQPQPQPATPPAWGQPPAPQAQPQWQSPVQQAPAPQPTAAAPTPPWAGQPAAQPQPAPAPQAGPTPPWAQSQG